MKIIIILMMVGGGYYFFNSQKPKSDDGKKDKSAKVTSRSDDQVLIHEEVNKPNSYVQSDKDKVASAISEVHNLNSIYSAKLEKTELTGVRVEIIREYLRGYIVALGKAYKASSGHDKAALKSMKIFVESWYKKDIKDAVSFDQIESKISFETKGDLSETIANNGYLLTELSKQVKSNQRYIVQFRKNFYASMKKYNLQDENIKAYRDFLKTDFNKSVRLATPLNQSMKVFIDKLYRFNTFLLNNNKNNMLVIDQAGYKLLSRIISEMEAAYKDLVKKQNIYYANY